MTGSAQIWHDVFSTLPCKGRNKKTLLTYETVTAMVERLNFAFFVFVSFSAVFEMSRCRTQRYNRNGKHFVDSVPNAPSKSRVILKSLSSFFADLFLANIRSRLALNLSKLRYSLYAVCWEKIIPNKPRGMSVEMKEKELTVSKKIAKQKTEDYNTNIFHRCFNLFSHENVAP